MAVQSIQSSPSNFNQSFFNETGRTISSRIKDYFPPIRLNSELHFLDNLEKRLSKPPTNANKIAKVFSILSSIVGWGAFSIQLANTNTNLLGIEESSSLNEGLNYAIMGFPLSSLITIKQNLSDYSIANKTKDRESIDCQISNIAINIFATIGGIFFVMSKFAVEAAVSFGTSILALPFYGISYLIDISKKSSQTLITREFKKEFRQFIANDSDLNDTRKLEASLKFLLKQLQITDNEKDLIKSELSLNEKLRKDPKLMKERIDKRVDDLMLIKYKKLEKRIGKKAAESFRKNVKDALNDLNRCLPEKELAKDLVKEIQSGISAEIRNNLILILVKIASIVGFVAATILSGGALVPIFTIL